PVTLPLSGPADPVGPTERESYDDHLARVGRRPNVSAALLSRVERAGLLGHGGAFVPVGLKWRTALLRKGKLTVVANGAESEPLAAKDGTLIRQRPHLVLDGLLLTAQALGADRAVIWLHGDDLSGRDAFEEAFAERGWSGREMGVEIVLGPVHYLAGEAQAITRATSGGPALPFLRRSVTDPWAPQTIVHNVETLARLALLARELPLPRTRLLTVVGRDRRVLEVDETTTLEQVLVRLGWRTAPPAVLLGGYAGTWVRWADVAGLAVDETAMRAAGLTLGAGVVVPLADDACGVRVTADLVAYLASMSAQQCGPCLYGLPALAQHWAQLAEGEADRRTLSRLEADMSAVEGRGACRHPDGATRLSSSALDVFSAHLAAHVSGMRCRYRGRMALPGSGR
ncbi:MAG TPA: NADH-ubiquinone oxidoreductase-F iron-sulfur binding region domain-containing protein, partial [Propionibacteriaceae bacterium]|nr:NADH-ubiquinone oxidoreductase-F iron-sulfur binding region domain-containing protein [Propionibacteriaceae bacterium]